MRTTIRKLMLSSVLLSMVLLAAGAAYAAPLYFPHVATSIPWQTEIAIISTSDQPVTGTLKGMSDEGQLIETKAVNFSARGRKQISVANEFTNHTAIGYIVFETDSDAVQGYTKFYQAGTYRAAVPAVKEVNTSDIFISHIASNADWWTGVSLVNTTSAIKELTITFNNGPTRNITLNANEHKAFSIRSLFNDQPQPGIESAVIANASGVIGLELFGSSGWGTQLEGILLTDKTTSTLYYPHVASDDSWWTGIVAYNPSASTCTITITPYSAQGTALPSSTFPIAGKGKYVGAVAQLGLPAQTAWFKIDSTNNFFTGFELFGTTDGQQLGAYAGGGGTGAKEGIFAKIEKSGWTGIAFVNTEANAASVTLSAYNDAGSLVATQVLTVPGHAKVVNNPQAIFSQDISSATYIAYSSDRNVVGFQLNGSVDGTMLDGLPGLATFNTTAELTFFYDWNPQDPFNLHGTGLNSRRDAGEPYLSGFRITYEVQNYTTDESGIARLFVPNAANTITITVPNTNKPIGQKDLAALGLQFTMTLYEPNRVNYGPRFLIDFRDNQCQRSSGKIVCEIGMADGYITSPYKEENYLYSSPWTYDSGLNYQNDFVNALKNGQVPSPAGGMYQLGEIGKLISSYLNTYNQGAPYGYPYLLVDQTLGIVSHLFMDVRNNLGVPVYAPVGGTVCNGASSDFAICAGDVTIDINDICAVPNWQYGLIVTRGQLIGWTDPVDNISGHHVAFPLIHMGDAMLRDRGMSPAHFPYLTAEQIVMGAKPDTKGQIYLAPQSQIVSDYSYRTHLPHASVYTEK
jgi:hypothetical protein